MVRSMVHDYMKNPRSVILTVIPANVDVVNQDILQMAEGVDPEGQRTLGVLTKPDLVDEGAEKGVIDLIEGRIHQLALGWSIVRNLGQKQLAGSDGDRNAVEENFFRTKSPWNTLPKDKVGISALQERIREVNEGHTRREFYKVTLIKATFDFCAPR